MGDGRSEMGDGRWEMRRAGGDLLLEGRCQVMHLWMNARAARFDVALRNGRMVVGAAAAMLLLASAGCGRGHVAVSGQVLVDGQPMEEGSISFRPADGKGPSLGGAIEMGRYHVVLKASNAAGEKLVSITGIQRTGRRIPAGPPEPPGAMVDEILIVEFGQKSELTCLLAPGSNRQNFDLTAP